MNRWKKRRRVRGKEGMKRWIYGGMEGKRERGGRRYREISGGKKGKGVQGRNYRWDSRKEGVLREE